MWCFINVSKSIQSSRVLSPEINSVSINSVQRQLRYPVTSVFAALRLVLRQRVWYDNKTTTRLDLIRNSASHVTYFCNRKTRRTLCYGILLAAINLRRLTFTSQSSIRETVCQQNVMRPTLRLVGFQLVKTFMFALNCCYKNSRHGCGILLKHKMRDVSVTNKTVS